MSKPSRTTFRERLTDFVHILREEIITGKLAFGQYLPSEAALSDQYHLSKSSIRKGLDMLVDDGLIEKVARIGNRIIYANDAAGVHLNLGYYTSLEKESLLLEHVDRFQKQYPHIHIHLIPLPYDEEHHTVKLLLQHDVIDAVTINYSDFHAINEAEGATAFFEPQTIHQDMYPYLAETFMNDGILYVQPFIFSPVVLCYNKDHFKEAGCLEPDSSWDWSKLAEVASSLTIPSKERYGFCFHALSESRWPVFLLQSGIKLNRNKEDELDDAEKHKIIDSINVYRDIISNQDVFPFYLSESDADVESLFLQEKVSMIMTSYFSLNYLQDAPFQYDISPLPYIQEPKTLLLNIGLAVNKRSKNKSVAQLFVDFMLSMESQQRIRQETLSIPSVRPAAELAGDGAIYRPSRFQMYREIVPTFHLFTDIGLSSRQMVEFRNALRLYLAKMEEEKFYEKINMMM